MTYDLAIGDRLHSSWSLRGWLMFAKFDIPVKVHQARMYTDEFGKLLEVFKPSRTVPALRTKDAVIWDTLAMAETLAESHQGLWPADPAARAYARSVTAEMHSGFGALRDHCPMNLRAAFAQCGPSDAVLADIKRIETLWSDGVERFGGPWIAGEYSLADVFYAPVAMRIAGYGLSVSAAAEAYVKAHLADLSLRQWRAMGFAENWVQSVYDREYPVVDWPGPAVLAAAATERQDAENETCPYSGKPVTDFLEIDGRVFGFCNAFCRDKTVADALAWPKFKAIYEN